MKKLPVMNDEDLELTALEIMSKDEDLLAHGTWEAPVKRLAMRGDAMQVGNGYRITHQGRIRFARVEAGLPEEMRSVAVVPPPEWIVQSIDDLLIVLHRDETAVSGYETMTRAGFKPVVHEQMNDPDMAFLRGDLTGLLQAMLDAAWARGLRPSKGADDE